MKDKILQEVLEWYELSWKWDYEMGGCIFYIFKDNEILDYDIEYDLGFHN